MIGAKRFGNIFVSAPGKLAATTATRDFVHTMRLSVGQPSGFQQAPIDQGIRCFPIALARLPLLLLARLSLILVGHEDVAGIIFCAALVRFWGTLASVSFRELIRLFEGVAHWKVPQPRPCGLRSNLVVSRAFVADRGALAGLVLRAVFAQIEAGKIDLSTSVGSIAEPVTLTLNPDMTLCAALEGFCEKTQPFFPSLPKSGTTPCLARCRAATCCRQSRNN